MNPAEIMGMAIKDYYDGNRNASIIVHSPDFDPDVQPVSWYFRNFDGMPGIEQEAIELSRGKVLDIGAAAGAHSLELQKRGADITALELSSEACEIMKKRGVLKVLNRDIFEPPTEKYDTLLMLMNGIGIVRTLDGLVKFLQHIKNYLNPGGSILFDSANLVYLFSTDEPQTFHFNGDKKYYGEIEFVIEYMGHKSHNFFWLYVDFDTLCRYAEKEGFIPELITQDNEFQYLCRLTCG